MDISTVRSVFGVMPIGHLTAAQILAKKKRNQVLLIGGTCLAVGVGIYLGIKYEKARNRRIRLMNSASSMQANKIAPLPLSSSDKSVTKKTEDQDSTVGSSPSSTKSA